MKNQKGYTRWVIVILISVLAIGLVGAAWYYEVNKEKTSYNTNTTTITTNVNTSNTNATVHASTNTNITINTNTTMGVKINTPLNKLLVSITERGGDSIWLMDSEGNDASEIIPAGSLYNPLSPRLSPDGKKVVYTSNEATGAGIRLLDITSQESTLLKLNVEHPGYPKFSPDGKYVAIRSNTDDTIKIIIVNLTTFTIDEYAAPYFGKNYGTIVWSPNSEMTSFTLDNFIYSVTLDGTFTKIYDAGPLETVDLIGGETDERPSISLDSFSNDGDYIYFSEIWANGKNTYRINSDGTNEKQITFREENTERQQYNKGISPDNKYILLGESWPIGQDPNMNLTSLYDITTGEETIVYEGSKYGHSIFSPDSMNIAFSSFGEDPGIYIYSLKDKEFQKISLVKGQVREWR